MALCNYEVIQRSFRVIFVLAFVVGALLTINVYEAHVIAQQHRVIQQMVKNPACTISEGK